MEKAFFTEVREAFRELAERLGLEGPAESDALLLHSIYTRGAVEYRVYLDVPWEGGCLHIGAGLRTPDIWFTVGLEELAIAAGVVDKRGTVSYSGRNLKQMKKSLVGQRAFVEPLHPLLCGDPESAVRLMRRAEAREWSLRPEE